MSVCIGGWKVMVSSKIVFLGGQSGLYSNVNICIECGVWIVCVV